MKKITLIVLIAMIFLYGCIGGNARFGLKNGADCNDPTLRQVQKIPCYHEAAISASYYLSSDTAEGLCNDIWNEVGAPNKDNDIGKRAETDRNLCFFDIAKIIARHDGGEADATNICQNIDQGKYKTTLVGAPVSKQMCLEEVKRIARIRPEKYYDKDNENICSVIFILPLIIVFAFLFRD